MRRAKRVSGERGESHKRVRRGHYIAGERSEQQARRAKRAKRLGKGQLAELWRYHVELPCADSKQEDMHIQKTVSP